MQQHFLIDGYNVLHALGLMPRHMGIHGLEKARDALVDMVAQAIGEQSGVATIVFDAARAPRRVPDALSRRGIEIRFARHEEADDMIERLLRAYSLARQLTVVSSDHRLVKAAGRQGCAVMTSNDFLDWLVQRRQPSTEQPAEPTAKAEGLSKAEVEEWLRQFADLDNDPELREQLPLPNDDEWER